MVLLALKEMAEVEVVFLEDMPTLAMEMVLAVQVLVEVAMLEI